jgi:hypothetical protein
VTPGQAAAELARVTATVRQLARGKVVCLVVLWLAALIGLLGIAVWMSRPPWFAPGSAVPMLLLVMGIGTAVTAGVTIGRTLRNHRLSSAAREIETAAHLGSGELIGALELGDSPRGSSTLATLQRTRVSAALAYRDVAGLLPVSWKRLRTARRRAVEVTAAAVVAVGMGLASHPSRGIEVAALARPWGITFPPPPPPLQLELAESRAVRGERLPVRIQAVGRRFVILASRVPGEAVRRQTLAVTDGEASGLTGPVEAPTRFWAEDDRGEATDTMAVVPLDPLMLTDAELRLSYPDYLDRPDETLAGVPTSLTLPEGTSVGVRGRANHPVRRAALLIERSASVDTVDLRVRGVMMEGELATSRDATIRWILRPTGSVPGIRPPSPIDLTVVPDAGPAISIVYPGEDWTVGMDGSLPLVIEASDDHHLEDVRLFWWRESSAGVRDATSMLRLDEGRRKRLLVVQPSLDGAIGGLLPGDQLVYFAAARDANPSTGPAVSDTFRVRIATLTEMRSDVATRSETLAETARGVEANAEDLATEARAAERRMGRPEADPSAGGDGMAGRTDFGATEAGRELLSEAQEMVASLEAQAAELGALRRELESSELSDPDLRDQLARLESLLQEALEAGLKDRIRALDEALESLSRDDLQRAVSELSRDSDSLQDRIGRALELMERVAVEQSLKSAHERTRDLADRQERLAGEEPGGEGWSAAEEELAAQAADLESLSEDLSERLASEDSHGATRDVGEAARSLGEAATALREASRRSGSAATGEAASRSAEQAAANLREAEESLAAASESLARDWRAEAVAAVERATTESLDLAREQTRLVERLRSGEAPADLAGQQAAVREGLDNVSQDLAEAGKKTALLDRRSGSAVARAGARMDELSESLTTGAVRRAEAIRQGEAAVEALGDLASSLAASRQAMAEADSGTGTEEALERLARMGRQQLALNGETGELFLRLQEGREMSGSLQELAERQAALARELEMLSRESISRELGARPEELAGEAEDVARRLAADQLNPDVLSRQERLFRRLLDAGRTLERRDEDPGRRESATARRGTRAVVPEIDPRLLAGPRHPYPEEGDLEGLSAAQRRMVYEYFDRLNRGPPARDGGP